MTLRWSREDLARFSGVGLASIFLIERFGTATEVDDARIRDALARGLAEKSASQGVPQAEPSGRAGAADPATPDGMPPGTETPRPRREC